MKLPCWLSGHNWTEERGPVFPQKPLRRQITSTCSKCQRVETRIIQISEAQYKK
jgi:hypothetical protein